MIKATDKKYKSLTIDNFHCYLFIVAFSSLQVLTGIMSNAPQFSLQLYVM